MTDVDTTKKLHTVLSFCSGYGGIERGLDLAGFEHRTVAYVEIEAYAIANLANKMERGQLLPAPIWSNLKTLPVQPFRDKVDLITGGYPCQPFSAAGKRLGEEDPRHLWPHIRRHIEAIRPVRCFFENVEGHITLGLREVISDLESLGYRTTWGIFSAREVGAPHQRKRVYILADSNGVRCNRGQLSDRVSKRPMEIEAQQRPQQPVVRSKIKGCSGDIREDVADSNGIRLEEHGHGKPAIPVKTSRVLADSKSIGVQGLRPSGKQEPDTHGESELPLRESQRPEHANWEAEPRMGRVVDGCADRVDRIRLLGNGVVPQAAAKAWITLNKRFN